MSMTSCIFICLYSIKGAHLNALLNGAILLKIRELSNPHFALYEYTNMEKKLRVFEYAGSVWTPRNLLMSYPRSCYSF